MAFDHADGLRRHACVIERLGDGLGLAVHGGCQIARLLRAIIVDSRAFDDGPDVIAVRNCIAQTAQGHGHCPGAKDGALGAVVKGMAMTVRRKDFVFLKLIAPALRQFDGHTARQRHIHLACAECLARVVDRHQRRGTGGLQVDRRTL